MNKSTVLKAIQDKIDHKTAIYKEELANSPKPGNPFLNALKGQIDGLREAYQIILKEV